MILAEKLDQADENGEKWTRIKYYKHWSFIVILRQRFARTVLDICA